jgi:hypothetical protein
MPGVRIKKIELEMTPQIVPMMQLPMIFLKNLFLRSLDLL